MLTRVAPLAPAVAFDLPGFGHADKPESFSYTVEGYARFLERAFGQLTVERAHLVLAMPIGEREWPRDECGRTALRIADQPVPRARAS